MQSLHWISKQFLHVLLFKPLTPTVFLPLFPSRYWLKLSWMRLPTQFKKILSTKNLSFCDAILFKKNYHVFSALTYSNIVYKTASIPSWNKHLTLTYSLSSNPINNSNSNSTQKKPRRRSLSFQKKKINYSKKKHFFYHNDQFYQNSFNLKADLTLVTLYHKSYQNHLLIHITSPTLPLFIFKI